MSFSPRSRTVDEEVNDTPTLTLPNVEMTNTVVDPGNDTPPTLQVQVHPFVNIKLEHEMPADTNTGKHLKLILTKKKSHVWSDQLKLQVNTSTGLQELVHSLSVRKRWSRCILCHRKKETNV